MAQIQLRRTGTLKRRVHEKEWFARHPQYKDIQHVCGIDRLMDTMISLLAEKMITEIPILVTLMKKRKKEVRKSLTSNDYFIIASTRFSPLYLVFFIIAPRSVTT